ncbi:caffeine-induced death protein 2-domain-containing protein [Cantharellus anzutake]|uniref:caffeine-induced death protein 2-domain-containing protein n=1 Tax=Cantharellus anzutake TaxID=1750568 RepID=UPI00190777E3|nr:caffeine-induced death protein 2-domain-containing protein [Cantharellus anzutake]XP_038912348.1 caffeine-induced death protein 2-domain-containing protein [Cantharellus anzutake]KAF8316505.1 caffeine-induced death protein 2-domain-containing protein [Cantharellus anzutake]KAF8325555.1 caffeine-induced death protein 2-domain-containing protein [Cantharellus anzutake]
MVLHKPLLGSAAVEAPTTRTVRVTESTCLQLSLFKDIIKEYRSLDDGITMRLNRNSAQWRDRDRSSGHSSKPDEPCEFFWKQLVANWKGRKEVIDYCVDVVDKNVTEKKKSISGQEEGLDGDQKSRSIRFSLFSDEILRNQIRQELAVEAIVRRRSWEAFSSRCKYFEPPKTDAEARKWWGAAISGRHAT